ncbi:hypothetical protein C7212DRAFT_308015 [Tuber magnatum]|uniref:Uncharacterized protein n=1 Tax=Tuber magnatum TaxID=42249 RepID=A0A317T1I6_9PEZI|nr:hypothetical protein C7212DRAFT_308015 [Tuber magnatum]
MGISCGGYKPPAYDPAATGSNDIAPANSRKDTIPVPPESAFDMDVGEFLKDRLDGHVTSYPRHTEHPWPTGLYPAVPSTYADGLEGHEFLWAEAAVIEKKRVKAKPLSLTNLENSLTHLRSGLIPKSPQPKEQKKQSRAFKRSLRAHRLRLQTLVACAKRVIDTVREIYEVRENGFFMNGNERREAAEIELRVWRIKVAARKVRWLRNRASEFEELARDLKEIILLEIGRNKSICKQLRERYRSVIWGKKGWKADEGLVESDGAGEEWNSERSEESDGSGGDDESEDTEDESEEEEYCDDDETQNHPNSGGSRRKSGNSSGGTTKKRFPFIRLVVGKGRGE